MKEGKTLTKSEAKEKALRLLGFRSHSEKELCDKLKMAGANPDDLPEIVQFLKEYKFLDDGEYSKRLAKDLYNVKKLGKKRISAELKKRGIDNSLIDSAILQLPEEEEEMLLPLVRKKLGGNAEQKNVDKAFRYFLYRGYSFDNIKSCIERVKQELEENF